MERTRHRWNDGFTHRPLPRRLGTISEQQAADYDESGFFVMRGVFDGDRMAELDRAIEPGEERIRSLLEQLPDGRLSVAGLDTQTVAPNMVGTSAVLRGICADPTLLGIATDVLGPDVRLYWEQAVYKQPNSAAPVLWHQDNGYTYVEPQSYLTCWIAITDATLDNGCISVMPGAHRDGTLAHRSTPLGEECWGDWSSAVDVPVDAGDVVVFSSLTPHATRQNTTDAVRKAYIVQYVPDGAVAHHGDAAGEPGPARPLEDPVLNELLVVDGRPAASSG